MNDTPQEIIKLLSDEAYNIRLHIHYQSKLFLHRAQQIRQEINQRFYTTPEGLQACK